MSRIYQYPMVTEIGSDDYLALGSATNGSRAILASDLAPVIGNKTITERGTYEASDDNMDGYGQVTVDIPYTDIHVASGDIATFEGEDLPLKSLKVTVTPYQDLHGYDGPWAGGAGKNKLPLTVENLKAVNTSGTWNGDAYTLNNIVFTIQKDSNNNVTGININGTASAQTQFTLITKNRSAFLVSGTSYTMTGCPSNGSDNTYRLLLSDDLVDTYRDYGSGVTFIPADALLANNYSARFVISSGQAFTNYTFKPMIRLASVSDATFAPYSNICPIIGWDEAVVNVTGINIWDEEWESGQYNGNLSTGVISKSADATRIRSKNDIPVVPNTTYYLKSTQPLFAYFLDADKNWINRVGSNGTTLAKNATFTTPDNCYFIKFFTINTATYNNDISINYPSTDTSYHAYNGATYTIDLDETRYGGVLDATNGTMLDTLDHIASYNGETLPSTWISDRDVYAEGATPTIGAEVVYTRATPITVQLAPTPARSIEGENNISANCGAVNVEYQTVWVRPSN